MDLNIQHESQQHLLLLTFTLFLIKLRTDL